MVGSERNKAVIYARGEAVGWWVRGLGLMKMLLRVGQKWLLFLLYALAAVAVKGWGVGMWRYNASFAIQGRREEVQGWREYISATGRG